MALLRSKDLRNMRPDDRQMKLKELNDELMHERGVAAMGGAPASPGRIRALRKNIARIMTIEREMELGVERPVKAPSREREREEEPEIREGRTPLEEAEDEETETDDEVGHDKEEKN